MAGGSDIVSCSSLGDRTSFEDYILKLRNFSGRQGSLGQLDLCRPEICNALWGPVNGDIAGPGVTASYIIGNSLSLFSIVALTAYWETSKYFHRSLLSHRTERQIGKCIEALHMCIVWLCISTQIASIVLLVKVDFGLDAAGMEFPSMEITWMVSTLMLLPLVHLSFLPSRVGYRGGGLASTGSFSSYASSEDDLISPKSEIFRLRALSFCWLLSGYPFLSRMLETFSPSKIGNGPGSAITTDEWAKIQQLCLDGVETIPRRSRTLFTAFGILSWIWVTIFTIAGLVRIYLTRQDRNEESKVLDEVTRSTSMSPATGIRSVTCANFIRFLLITVNPMLAAFSIWAIFRLQEYQADISEKTGGPSDAADWTFGQVMAILIYGPVCLELYNLGKIYYRTHWA
ncbi:hypothetical protein TWF281_007677 [Arthrobotrys megalospora]